MDRFGAWECWWSSVDGANAFLLWWLSGDRRLGDRARELIADPDAAVCLTAFVMWKIRVKQGHDVTLDVAPGVRLC